MRVYKAVHRIGDKFVSLLASGDLEIEYKVGECAVPEIGRIFCFSSLEAAENFVLITMRNAFDTQNSQILVGEGDVDEELPNLRMLLDDSLEWIVSFWEAMKYKSTDELANRAPAPYPGQPGTVLCKSFKPEAEVWTT